jgi:Flp pilus assembly protein TadG
MDDEVVVGVRRGPRTPAATRTWSVGAGDERGAVTAEAAAVLPLLVAFAMGMVWVFAVAVAQVRVVDGAREAARAAARGDTDADAIAKGQAVAPAGARFAVRRDGQQIRVSVSADIHGPGGLFARLPGVRVSSRSVATEEPQ